MAVLMGIRMGIRCYLMHKCKFLIETKDKSIVLRECILGGFKLARDTRKGVFRK